MQRSVAAGDVTKISDLHKGDSRQDTGVEFENALPLKNCCAMTGCLHRLPFNNGIWRERFSLVAAKFWQYPVPALIGKSPMPAEADLNWPRLVRHLLVSC